MKTDFFNLLILSVSSASLFFLLSYLHISSCFLDTLKLFLISIFNWPFLFSLPHLCLDPDPCFHTVYFNHLRNTADPFSSTWSRASHLTEKALICLLSQNIRLNSPEHSCNTRIRAAKRQGVTFEIQTCCACDSTSVCSLDTCSGFSLVHSLFFIFIFLIKQHYNWIHFNTSDIKCKLQSQLSESITQKIAFWWRPKAQRRKIHAKGYRQKFFLLYFPLVTKTRLIFILYWFMFWLE